MQAALHRDWCDERSICPTCRESLRDCECPDTDTEPDTMETTP